MINFSSVKIENNCFGSSVSSVFFWASKYQSNQKSVREVSRFVFILAYFLVFTYSSVLSLCSWSGADKHRLPLSMCVSPVTSKEHLTYFSSVCVLVYCWARVFILFCFVLRRYTISAVKHEYFSHSQQIILIKTFFALIKKLENKCFNLYFMHHVYEIYGTSTSGIPSNTSVCLLYSLPQFEFVQRVLGAKEALS